MTTATTTHIVGIGRLCTMDPDLGVIEQGQLLVRNGRFDWVGRAGDLPPIDAGEAFERVDCGGRVALPGLIDCHTHLVFGGDRADEFSLRASGVSYEEVARRGGGIRATVRATRAASARELAAAASGRLDAMLRRGVTCVEIKSGYGLDLETELKMLRVARILGESHPVHVVPTFLGAHTVPPEARSAEHYVDEVINEMLPQVALEQLADFCDVFCEEGAFTIAQSRRVLEAGLRHGLRPKVHAEQLHRTGATALGVELGAVSVDHLEQASEADIRRLAEYGDTTAVLLPGATLYLGLDDWAPARRLLDAGVRVALSTDCNPGSCMCDHLPLMTTLACTRLGMSPGEALEAITLGAAWALGIQAERGSITPGKVADLLVLDATNEAALPYRFGNVAPHVVLAQGRVVIGPARRWHGSGSLQH